jgi:hypothetical protein
MRDEGRTTREWAYEEFGHTDLGDARRTARFVRMAAGLAEQPGGKAVIATIVPLPCPALQATAAMFTASPASSWVIPPSQAGKFLENGPDRGSLTSESPLGTRYLSRSYALLRAAPPSVAVRLP